MTVTCPKHLFKAFKECNGWITPDKDGQEFLYDALFQGFELANVVQINIPELDIKTFNDWDKFENWCSDIKNQLMWDIVDDSIANNEFNNKNNTPKKYFKTKEKVKQEIIKAICSSESEEVESVTYVEIECEGEKLYLLYSDSDSWTLGWGDTVTVAFALVCDMLITYPKPLQ